MVADADKGLYVTDESNKDGDNDLIDVIWAVLGCLAGVALLAKWAEAADISPHEKLSTGQGLVMLFILFAPPVFFYKIGEFCRKEVIRDKMSWEAYWVILSGIAGALFTFLGLTGVDELLEMLKTIGIGDGE